MDRSRLQGNRGVAVDQSSGRESPEVARQADRGKDRLRLIGGLSSPGWVGAVVVPNVGQAPHLLQCEHGVQGMASSLDVLLATEEQHRASRVDDVLPPASGGDGKVDHGIDRVQSAVGDIEDDRLLAVRARGLHPAFAAESDTTPKASQMQLPKYWRPATSTMNGVGTAEKGLAIRSLVGSPGSRT